jgi:predicted transcriptional regulator
MSTRCSHYGPIPVLELATDGSREFQLDRTEPIPLTKQPTKEALGVAGSCFVNPELTVRPPVTEHITDWPDGGRWASLLKSDVSARDLMSACMATLRPEDSIERAARLMSEGDSGSIPVVDSSGRLLGVLTDRDITAKLIARGSSIPHAQVSDCMTSEAFACSAGSSLESCVRALAWHQVRLIPVVDDEHRVVGTISQGDIARYACEHSERVERGVMVNILWALAY